jgi:hypothetical protein
MFEMWSQTADQLRFFTPITYRSLGKGRSVTKTMSDLECMNAVHWHPLTVLYVCGFLMHRTT